MSINKFSVMRGRSHVDLGKSMKVGPPAIKERLHYLYRFRVHCRIIDKNFFYVFTALWSCALSKLTLPLSNKVLTTEKIYLILRK